MMSVYLTYHNGYIYKNDYGTSQETVCCDKSHSLKNIILEKGRW